MLQADVVRAQPAVQAFDFREILKEYGFFTIGTKADLEAARKLVDTMVEDGDTLMTQLATDCKAIGQNPYKQRVELNGGSVAFAMEIPLFPAGELTARIKSVFETAERSGQPVPDAPTLARKIRDGIAALAREANYEVCGIDVHDDGSPQRIVLRDPTYAQEAAQREGEDKVPDIKNIATLLGDQRVKKHEHSAEAIGITGKATAEQVQTVRAVAKNLVDQAESVIMERLVALDGNEVSPFSRQPFRFSGHHIDFVERKLVSWGWGRSIAKPVVIDVLSTNDISRALTRADSNHRYFVNEHTFGQHVRTMLVERLRAVPNLPLAAIATTDEGYNRGNTRVILVAPEVWARTQPERLALLAPNKALPAPAQQREAIPPVELPRR